MSSGKVGNNIRRSLTVNPEPSMKVQSFAPLSEIAI